MRRRPYRQDVGDLVRQSILACGGFAKSRPSAAPCCGPPSPEAGGRPLVHWFCQRPRLAELLRSLKADDVSYVDTPALRIELSVHDSPEAAREALAELAEQVALAAAQTRGAA